MLATPCPVEILTDRDYAGYQRPPELACPGSLLTSAGALPLQSLEIEVHIEGLFASIHVKQRFLNPFPGAVELRYVCAPEPGAELRRLEVRSGKLVQVCRQDLSDQEFLGEFLVYHCGQAASEATVEVSLVFDRALSWQDGAAHLCLPLLPGQRFRPQYPAPPSNEIRPGGQPSALVLIPGIPNPVEFSLDIQVSRCGLALAVPSISLNDVQGFEMPQGYRLVLSTTASRVERDLIVRLQLSAPQTQSSLLVQEEAEGNSYLALSLVPEVHLRRSTTPPRKVSFIIDGSAAMVGWKWPGARQALEQLLEALNEQDLFQVVMMPASPESSSWSAATERNKFRSLQRLTQGTPGGAATVPELVGKADESWVFILGSSPDPGLEALARNHSGSTCCLSLTSGTIPWAPSMQVEVEHQEQLDEAVRRLTEFLVPPLFGQVTLELPGEFQPGALTLREGRYARMLGHSSQPVPPQLTIKGHTRDGKPFRSQLIVHYCQEVSLATLWKKAVLIEAPADDPFDLAPPSAPSFGDPFEPAVPAFPTPPADDPFDLAPPSAPSFGDPFEPAAPAFPTPPADDPFDLAPPSAPSFGDPFEPLATTLTPPPLELLEPPGAAPAFPPLYSEPPEIGFSSLEVAGPILLPPPPDIDPLLPPPLPTSDPFANIEVLTAKDLLPVAPSLAPPRVPLEEIRQALSLEDWDQALCRLIEWLIRQGCPFQEVDPLVHFRLRVLTRSGPLPDSRRRLWVHQVEAFVEALLQGTTNSEESFWS